MGVSTPSPEWPGEGTGAFAAGDKEGVSGWGLIQSTVLLHDMRVDRRSVSYSIKQKPTRVSPTSKADYAKREGLTSSFDLLALRFVPRELED